MSDYGNQPPGGIPPSGYASDYESQFDIDASRYATGTQVLDEPEEPDDPRRKTWSSVSGVLAWVALAVAVAALIVAFMRSGIGGDGTDTAVSDTSDEMFGANSDDALAGSGDSGQQASPTTAATVQTVALGDDSGGGNDVTADPAPEGGYSFWSVVGISHNSSLNLRSAPGGDVVATLEPAFAGILPTGTSSEADGAVWYEVSAGGAIGWVSGQYVSPLGLSFDVTADAVVRLGDEVAAANLSELSRRVTAFEAAVEPEPRIRTAVAPVTDEEGGGTITMDVIGVADDSIRGYRLAIVASPGEGGEGVVLSSVQATLICYAERGVSAQGVCN